MCSQRKLFQLTTARLAFVHMLSMPYSNCHLQLGTCPGRALGCAPSSAC